MSSSSPNTIDRMSNDCVRGIQAAHEWGNALGLAELRTEVLLVGMVRHPERAKSTLQSFDMTFDTVEPAARKFLQYQAGVTLGSSVSNNNNNNKVPLPFDADSKSILTVACKIADSMESPTVRSEHVLLALLGYTPTQDKIQTVPVLGVLQDMASTLPDDFSVTKLCTALIHALPLIPVAATSETDLVVDRVVIGQSSSSTSTNTLAQVGIDWTQLALEGMLDPVQGRTAELIATLRTLGRRRKHNPCLVGDPGVGKTAIAEGVAQVLAQGLRRKDDDDSSDSDDDTNDNTSRDLPDCPPTLVGARLVSIELAGLVAGTSNRGDFEQRLQKIIQEATDNNVILFIDELHNLIGTGGGDGDGALNAANILKPALARGKLRLLGATTTPEYRRYIEKDGALERRFQPILVKEPTVYETLDILASVAPKYESYHNVEFTYNAMLEATKLSNRYISDRFLPDKAIDLMDEAAGMVTMSNSNTNKSKLNGDDPLVVTEDNIRTVISELTGIPLGKLDTGEKKRLQNLEQALEERIKGQHPAVRAVAKSIRRARSGMRDGKRPVASLMFCGPTGVGKTELCKALAETYYGQEKDMIRIDMSEYMDRFSTSRLIGAPPGYVGYEEGGQLTEAVRRAPHSVILFDELEKAHEDVLNLLLQIMDEGTLTDGKGRTISFKNNIFVMTSNIGSKEIIEVAKSADDSAADGEAAQLTTDVVKSALEEAMRPELLNRIDEIIVFSPLSYDSLLDIAKNLIAQTVDRAKDDQGITLTVSNNIAEIITREALGTASTYGARPIRRAVQRYLEDTLAEAIMSEFIDEGDSVSVNLKDPNSGKKVVEIKRTLDGKAVLIDVDEDAGISKESLDFQATYGNLPKLDGPPKREPDSFQ